MKQSRIDSFYEWSMKKKPLYWLLGIFFWVIRRISNGVLAISSRLEEPYWRSLGKRFLQAVGIMVALIIVLVLVRIGYAYEWIGFGQTEVKGEIRSSKTLWDWLNLLIVPVVLAIGGYLFTRSDTKATQ